jgi:hypothetical protein
MKKVRKLKKVKKLKKSKNPKIKENKLEVKFNISTTKKYVILSFLHRKKLPKDIIIYIFSYVPSFFWKFLNWEEDRKNKEPQQEFYKNKYDSKLSNELLECDHKLTISLDLLSNIMDPCQDLHIWEYFELKKPCVTWTKSTSNDVEDFWLNVLLKLTETYEVDLIDFFVLAMKKLDVKKLPEIDDIETTNNVAFANWLNKIGDHIQISLKDKNKLCTIVLKVKLENTLNYFPRLFEFIACTKCDSDDDILIQTSFDEFVCKECDSECVPYIEWRNVCYNYISDRNSDDDTDGEINYVLWSFF